VCTGAARACCPRACCPHAAARTTGYTLGLLFAELYIVGLWLLGSKLVARITLRNMSERDRRHRMERFKSTVLSRLLLMLYVVYPGACGAGVLVPAACPHHARTA
jgi:hypothetical protein